MHERTGKDDLPSNIDMTKKGDDGTRDFFFKPRSYLIFRNWLTRLQNNLDQVLLFKNKSVIVPSRK